MSLAEPRLQQLFQAHRQGLAGAVRSVLGPAADVAEVLQDAFLKCWRKWQDGTRPQDAVAWMFVITWNTAADVRRSRQRRPVHQPFDEHDPVAHTIQPPSMALEQRETIARAEAAIGALSDPEQQVFLLRVSGEQTFEAIAQALAIPLGTAKTRMRAALAKVRAAMGVNTTRQEQP